MKPPKEWLETPHYELHMAWLTAKRDERIAPEAEELQDHPGWWVWCKINSFRNSVKPVVELALSEATDSIKNWQLDQNPEFSQNKKAPHQAEPPEREELIRRLLESRRTEVGDDGLMYELFQPYGDFALLAQVFFAPFREDFKTTFGAANNPARSLEGRVCKLIDFETDEVFSQGGVSMQGNRLTVGFWSKEFAGNLEVGGVAYAEAFWESGGVEFYLYRLEGGE
ncbi:MAG: hypothetical protein SFU83_09800 [Meiothermus sp.]|nr:hypothetical protein [Meiothermus sp.]